jgi:hypothetical protein
MHCFLDTIIFIWIVNELKIREFSCTVEIGRTVNLVAFVSNVTEFSSLTDWLIYLFAGFLAVLIEISIEAVVCDQIIIVALSWIETIVLFASD